MSAIREPPEQQGNYGIEWNQIEYNNTLLL